MDNTLHKHGYQTSEFWLTTLVSVPAFLVGAGLIPTGDQPMLTDALTKVVSGIIAAVTLWKYIQSRTAVKATLYENSMTVPGILLGLFLFCSPTYAQQPAQTQIGLLCFGGHKSQQPSANTQLLQQIASQNAQIMAQNQQIIAILLARNSTPQAQAPTQPQLIVLANPTPQLPQTIPLGPSPLQNIPLGGPPAQQIPLGGPPAQQIPLGNPPAQQIPLGNAPLQQIPLGNAPQQIQQAQPQLVPVPQQTAPPPLATPQQTIPLGQPARPLGPTGYQNYSQLTPSSGLRPVWCLSSSSSDSIWVQPR
jgi:hypothetical protein